MYVVLTEPGLASQVRFTALLPAAVAVSPVGEDVAKVTEASLEFPDVPPDVLAKTI